MDQVILGGCVVVWGVVHSWLATTRMKNLTASKLGGRAARVYRLAYNVFSLISFAPIALLMRGMPDRLLYRVPMPWALILLAGQALAALLIVAALLQTDILHFGGLSQMLGRQSSTGMISTGFYRLVRHPLYLFGLLILWLTPFMSLNQLTVYAVLTAYLFVGARLEEGIRGSRMTACITPSCGARCPRTSALPLQTTTSRSRRPHSWRTPRPSRFSCW